MKRSILIFIGFIFYTIGILGFFLPGLPGTIFIIMAAFCFLKSSPKLYNRIINNKQYGLPVKNFIEFKVIPYKVKKIILLCIWGFSLLSIFYLNDYKQIYTYLILLLAILGSAVVISAKKEVE